MRKRIVKWLLKDHPPGQPAPKIEAIDFEAAEQAFLAHNKIGLISAGALAIRCTSDKPGPTFHWRPLRETVLSRFLRAYLVDHGQSHLWSVYAVEQFQAFLAAGAQPKPEGEKFLVG